MRSFLKRVVIPRLHRHFSSAPLKKRLRMLYQWHENSFEQWLKWEFAFSLDGVFPWDEGPTQWCLEYSKRRKDLGVVDMALLGPNPLFLHFKVFIPGGFKNLKWIRGPGNSLKRDIEKARRFRDGPAAAILFLIERPKERIDLEEEGLPPPDNARSRKIRLGDVEYKQRQYHHDVYARLLYWSNGV